MNKKGFTLIELLISIIIIGIIAVIAIPSISNILKNSRINSFEASAKSIAKKVKNEYIAGNIPGTQVDCMNSKYGTDTDNYSSCKAKIYVNEDDAIVSVDIVGINNYSGLTIIGAKEDLAHAFETGNAVSLKTTLLATLGNKDVDVNKYNGNGLYRWGNKFIYRGGITKTNAAGLATADYLTDTDSGTDVSNFIQVPWETYTAGETCTSTSNKCWRIMSINPDGSVTIIRDKNESNVVFDATVNTAARVANNNYVNNYGYNDLLANIPTVGYPEEYRPYSNMYTVLYSSTGYELNKIIKFINLLKPSDVCLNKVNNYAGLNNATYSTTTYVKDTCDVAGKASTTVVNSLKNKYVRILYTEEYLNASLESTCTSTGQYQCRSQNYLYNKTNIWSINGYSITSAATVRTINATGIATANNAYNTYGIKLVVNLTASVLIVTGDTGTAADPYVIKW